MGAAKDKPFSGPVNVSQDRWDKIFGKKTAKPKRGRYVDVNGKLVHESEVVSKPSTGASAPAIHDDKIYTKKFDYGAGRKWNSRTERREWMKKRGCECTG